MSTMISEKALKRVAIIGTLLLAGVFGTAVVASPKPREAALHPSLRTLPAGSEVHTQTYVS
ncbi:MAG TPA: hypothetical protein VE258_09055 [Ktedonobacterales bacterium]|nr:hypothetical protein [Ktedonobacterales bacterium]